MRTVTTNGTLLITDTDINFESSDTILFNLISVSGFSYPITFINNGYADVIIEAYTGQKIGTESTIVLSYKDTLTLSPETPDWVIASNVIYTSPSTIIMTKSEIITLAFNRKISETKILTNVIESCQNKYLKPVLTEDLWDAFYADPTNATYTTLLTYCKTALAWWVKYTILPEIFTEISDTGVHQINASNAQTVTDQRFIEVRSNCADIAQRHTDRITEYLNDNTATFTLYNAGINPDSNIEVAGSIIFRTNKTLDATEDGPEKWHNYY